MTSGCGQRRRGQTLWGAPGRWLVLLAVVFASAAMSACGGSVDDNAAGVAAGDAPAVQSNDSDPDSASARTSDATGGDSGDSNGGEEAKSGDDGQPETDAAEVGVTSDEPETLDDYFDSGFAGLLGGGPLSGGLAGFDGDSVLEEQRQIEQQIRECMALQGFEYEAEESGGAGFATFFEAVGATEELSPQEYAEREGFGISTLYDAMEDGVDAAVNSTGDDASANQAMLAEMSEGERNAWFVALEGEVVETDDQGRRLDPETGEPIQGIGQFAADGGCRFEAQGDVRTNFEAIQELSDEFEELDNRIEADARITEIRRAWSTCMGEGGYFFDDEAEARAELQAEFIPFALTLLGGVSAGGIVPLSDERAAALVDLQDRERDIAVTSLNCIGDSEEEIAEIRARYESEFIAANRSALEAIRDN